MPHPAGSVCFRPPCSLQLQVILHQTGARLQGLIPWLAWCGARQHDKRVWAQRVAWVMHVRAALACISAVRCPYQPQACKFLPTQVAAVQADGRSDHSHSSHALRQLQQSDLSCVWGVGQSVLELWEAPNRTLCKACCHSSCQSPAILGRGLSPCNTHACPSGSPQLMRVHRVPPTLLARVQGDGLSTWRAVRA